MADIFEETLKRIDRFSDKNSKFFKSFFKRILNNSERYATQGKIKLEIEKLKWDLRQLYKDFGCYIYKKNHKSGIMDFSHDVEYIHFLEKIKQQLLYLDQRYKDLSSTTSNYSSNEKDLEIKNI